MSFKREAHTNIGPYPGCTRCFMTIVTILIIMKRTIISNNEKLKMIIILREVEAGDASGRNVKLSPRKSAAVCFLEQRLLRLSG